MSQPIFGRILLKLSGEALIGTQGFGVDPVVARRIAEESRKLGMGVQVAVVVGGGNFIRGAASAMGIDRVADNMGMLATVINAPACKHLQKGAQTRGDRH